MKTFLTLTAAIIGGILMPALVMAGPTETITGCATVPVEGSNYTVRADVTCALSTDESDGSGLLTAFAAAALIDALTPDEEEDAE
jgi:hypothetical protein